ncbi:MAG: hypothetical protein ACRC92_09480 [Peptostreptococcaceae bacterium]
MNKLESLKLFQDLQLVSSRYADLKLKDNNQDIEDNKKLNSLLEFYKSNIKQIKERSHFISVQTRNELKNSNTKDIYKLTIDLNNFARDKYAFIKSNEVNVESSGVQAVMLTTIDELNLINESIRNKDYLKDKNTYFYIYEKITINSFAIFLALKDMEIEKEKINSFSQAILSQIQTLSIISM